MPLAILGLVVFGGFVLWGIKLEIKYFRLSRDVKRMKDALTTHALLTEGD